VLAGRGLHAAPALCAFWVFAEWLRGWVFTGFPWNLIGSARLFSDHDGSPP
jgi:apolipoprotein N-acyltransferase